jgi:lipopolysaccharide export system permease protein
LETDWPEGYKIGRRKLVTVLDKMIVGDLLKTLLSVLAVIVLIIVSRQFIRVLDEAIAGQVSNETLLSILGFKTIVAGSEFLPVALFMAVLMVLGRMYRDQEMAAVASAGGGSGVIYRAVFLMVFPLTLVSAVLSFYVAPWAETSVAKLMQHDEESSDIRGIAAGKFSAYSQGDLVFYVESIGADKKMHQVFVQNRQHGNAAVINADTAQLKDLPDGRYLVFEQGERVQGEPGTLTYVIEQFAEYAVRIDTKVTEAMINMHAMAVDLLWPSKAKNYIAEFQRRFSIPSGALLLSFIAVPLAQIAPRSGVYGNMLAGFLIYFSYGNLTRISQGWVMTGTIPVWLGGFGVNILLLLIGSFLLARLYGWRWLIMKLRRKAS